MEEDLFSAFVNIVDAILSLLVEVKMYLLQRDPVWQNSKSEIIICVDEIYWLGGVISL